MLVGSGTRVHVSHQRAPVQPAALLRAFVRPRMRCLRALTAAAARPRVSRPALHAAAASAPRMAHQTARDVNCYWFGEEWESNRAALSMPAFFDANTKRWFSGGPDADAECRLFADVIHAAGRGELDAAPGWGDTPGARVAKVVLLDQLTRGAFRCASRSSSSLAASAAA